MPTAGLEAAIPSMQWSQTYALDQTATGIQFRLAPDLRKRNHDVSWGGGCI